MTSMKRKDRAALGAEANELVLIMDAQPASRWLGRAGSVEPSCTSVLAR
jgi:hypothetical protein